MKKELLLHGPICDSLITLIHCQLDSLLSSLCATPTTSCSFCSSIPCFVLKSWWSCSCCLHRSVTLSRGSWQGCTNLVTGNSNEQVLRGKASFSKASAANAVQGSVYMEQLQGALGQVGVTTIFSTGLRDIRSSVSLPCHC